jgi:hypothetical protein
MAKPTKMNLHYRNKMLYEHRPSEAWFLSYILLRIEENAQSVYFELQHRMLHM